VQHSNAAQELLLHRRAARIRELDLTNLIAPLCEGNTRGQRNCNQQHHEMGKRSHMSPSNSKMSVAAISCCEISRLNRERVW